MLVLKIKFKANIAEHVVTDACMMSLTISQYNVRCPHAVTKSYHITKLHTHAHTLYQLSNMALAWTLFSVDLERNRPISVLLKPSSYARTVHSKPSWLEISCSVFRLITAS